MRRAVLTGLVATTALVLTAPAASAAQATSYHGQFTEVIYSACEGGTPPAAPASGTWNVAVRGSALATATFDIFVNGVHHVAYGVPGLPVTTTASGWSFSFETGAGTLVVSWDGSDLAYDFPDGYSYGGLVCDRVTYLGS